MVVFGGLLRKTAWLSFLTAASCKPLDKRCASDPAWNLTPENYKNSGADAWFETWRQGKTFSSTNTVFQQLVNEFVTGNHAIYCPTRHGEVNNCRNADFSCAVMNLEDSDTLKAYFVIEAMVNVNSIINYFGDAVNEVVIDQILRQYQMVSTFTQPVRADPNTDMARRLFSAFSTALFVLGGIVSVLGIPTTIIAGGFSQLSLGLPANPSQADATLNALGDYSAFVDSVYGKVQEDAANLISTLYGGQPDNNGHYIWDYIKDGVQMYSLSNNNSFDKTTDILLRVMTAGVVNVLWKMNNVYIVGATTSDCQNDNRGPSDVRFCLEDDPGHVYYMMMMDTRRSDQVAWTHVQVSKPQGYDQLGSLKVPLSLQDAFRSSIATYKSSGYNYETVRNKRLFNSMASGTFNQTDPSTLGALEGVWSIPVCMDDAGMAISQIDSGKGINYPCLCGSNGQDTGAFAASGSLMGYDVYDWWCGKQLEDREIPL
ncbi:hypothetical protein BGZ63DRAFT_425037 [Mariannaea sp. PMI_226]|nr:hypothetical protein BGZ63DRAFT_425037 [Mariannaea sp. PMI_226]